MAGKLTSENTKIYQKKNITNKKTDGNKEQISKEANNITIGNQYNNINSDINGHGKRNLILHCDLSPGDILTLTSAIKSLHDTYPNQYNTDIRTPVPAIWEYNPYITKIKDENGEHIKTKYDLINKSNQTMHHFLHGYVKNLRDTLNIPLEITTNRPHLYLSDQEKNWQNQVADMFCGNLKDKNIPFWIVNAGIKHDYTAKQWPLEFYQEVINKTIGKIQWVQIGSLEHNHTKLDNVLDLIGRTDQRQLIRLTYHAVGGLGPSTYLQHLMAAWEKPYVCLLGGREPVTWVQYPKQTTLHTMGALECCRNSACWKSRVVPIDKLPEKNTCLCKFPVLGLKVPVAKCMAMIKPEEVLLALDKYI